MVPNPGDGSHLEGSALSLLKSVRGVLPFGLSDLFGRVLGMQRGCMIPEQKVPAFSGQEVGFKFGGSNNGNICNPVSFDH